MFGNRIVLIALDEQSLSRLMEVMLSEKGIASVIADGQVDAFQKLEERNIGAAVTIPSFHGLALALTQMKPPIKTLLLCADPNTNGFRDSDHLQLLPIPCPTVSLREAMSNLAPNEIPSAMTSTTHA